MAEPVLRSIELEFVTQVLCPTSGITLTYPRMSDGWTKDMESNGYIVTHTEQEKSA